MNYEETHRSRAHVFPLDNASVLLRVVECAQCSLALQRNIEREKIASLVADVKLALDRPAEGDRVVHEETHIFAQLVVLADRALHQFDRERAIRLNRAIAAMMPDIQNDGARALEIRHGRPTP